MNEILLRRKNKVILGAGTASFANDRYITTIMKNIEELGYTFSREVFDVLRTYTDKELFRFYKELKTVLIKLSGADVVYMPMYADFPKGVMDADFSELYINAMMHYWSDGILYPKKHRKRVNDRLPLFDETKVKVLQLGSDEDVRQIFDNICMSRTSVSETDKADIAYLFEYENMKLPDDIPYKENAAYISAIYLQKNPLTSASELRKYVKTATDVLRLVTAMSGGDVSLSENTRYRSFTRRQRRMIMELLAGCPHIEEDMLRYKERWIRIGERIHPAEFEFSRYTLEYDWVINAFDKLRNDRKIETFAGEVETAISYGEYDIALSVLVKRPGELARRMDQLLRGTPADAILDDGVTVNPEKEKAYRESVIRSFQSVAEDVSTLVLLQLREHFAHRADGSDVRVFFPKGKLAKCCCVQNELPEIEERYCQAVVDICENVLVKIYGRRSHMGKVYLSEDYRNYIVPFSQRSAGRTLKTVVRGSRMPLDTQSKAIRAFVWWTNMDGTDWDSYDDGRVDLDLSAAIFDENWNYMEHVSYTNLKSERYRACHSGDIVNGGPKDGDGASEFLDVDVDSVVKYGARYVVYQLYSYTGQNYADMPHAMFGWMERANVESGEVFEPKTVKQKMDLTSNSTVCIPVIFDCVKREMIWCDMNLSLGGTHMNIGGNNLESNLSGVAAVCYAMVNLKKPNLYDLITLNVRGRGELVNRIEDADIVFDIERTACPDIENDTEKKTVVTPFDFDVFVGEYL